MRDVSIIYVNYKTADLILDSIRSVKEKTSGIDYEIIVVDNHSEDQSLERIQQAYPEVVALRAPENLGFGRANNLGLTVATGRCVFFLNPDTLLRNDAIGILYRYLAGSPDVAACGGNLFDAEEGPTTSFSRIYPSFFWELMSIFYVKPIVFPHSRSHCFNYTGKPLSVASIIGADLMVRREVLDRVGAFDPRFFMNYEETELCRRIRGAGGRIHALPEAQITHLEGKAAYPNQSRLSFLYEGQYIYFNKVYGYGGCLLIYGITQMKNYLRIFQFVLLMNRERLAYWKMKTRTNRQVWASIKKKGFKR